MNDIYYIQERDETSYFIFLDLNIMPDTTLIFDTTDGIFTEAPLVCENLVQGNYSSIDWVIGEIDNDYRLCNLITGETSEPIPAHCQTQFSSSGFPTQQYTYVSSDGNWLIFDDCRGTFYSYEIATETIIRLGDIDTLGVRLHYTVNWFDNFTVVMDANISDMTESISVYYRIDIRNENSMSQFYATSSDLLDPILLDNPPRYMWVDFTQARQTNEHYVEEYDILAGQYNRVFALYCSTQTEEAQPYFCGESNQALSYFAPITPDNPDYLIIYGNEYEGDIPTQITILDATTYDILYSANDFQVALAWFDTDDFEHLTNDSLLIAELSNFGIRAEFENLHLISFDPELQVQTIDGLPEIASLQEFSYDFRYIISEINPTESTSQYIIYDIISGEYIPLTKSFDPEIISIQMSWFSNFLRASLYRDGTLISQWRVTLP